MPETTAVDRIRMQILWDRLLAIVVRDTLASAMEDGAPVSAAIPRLQQGDSSRRISLIPLGEVSEQGAFQRGVQRFPTTGAEVHSADIAELNSIFTEQSAYRLPVGVLSTYRDLTVHLDPSTLFGRHFAILGQSGSGKSWAVASLLQRTVSDMPKV